MTLVAVAENALDPELLRATAARAGASIALGPVATPEDVARTTVGADALLVTLQPLRAEHIAALSSTVKVISRAGVGLDTVDVDAARARDIRVIYQPTYATNEVADHAASMALASWRLLADADRLMRETAWPKASAIGAIHALQEATLGVLGSGRIGRSVLSKLSPFVDRVLAFDAYADPSLVGVAWAETVGDLLAQSNLVTLHLPLTPETRHVIDAEAIASMPDGAVLVNVSRGGLVDEEALAEALHSGKLGAAALDVFEAEPLPADSPLRSAPRLLLSPHIAWYSIESGVRLTRWSVSDAVSFVQTGDVINGALA